MAISIDTVYQRVLALANKEQRGYITPQEFNLFANQAQQEIFEQYFYDVNQWNRMHGNDTSYSDMLTLLDEKIEIFETFTSVDLVTVGFGLGAYEFPSDIYRVESIYYTDLNVSPRPILFEKVTEKEYFMRHQSPLTKPTPLRPIYAQVQSLILTPSFASVTPSRIGVTYVRKPKKVQWGYFVVNDKALHDSDNLKTTNFELHASEESELVYRILMYAGVALQKPQLVQTVAGALAGQIQQEKK